MTKCFVLFELSLLLKLVSLVLNSVLSTKFACANLAVKTIADKLLSSGVVIYFSWPWSVSFFSISVIFAS